MTARWVCDGERAGEEEEVAASRPHSNPTRDLPSSPYPAWDSPSAHTPSVHLPTRHSGVDARNSPPVAVPLGRWDGPAPGWGRLGRSALAPLTAREDPWSRAP